MNVQCIKFSSTQAHINTLLWQIRLWWCWHIYFITTDIFFILFSFLFWNIHILSCIIIFVVLFGLLFCVYVFLVEWHQFGDYTFSYSIWPTYRRRMVIWHCELTRQRTCGMASGCALPISFGLNDFDQSL